LKFVIFNADDFGYTRGVNRGIVEAHRDGVVTSASLIVNGQATDEAVRLAAEMPDLSVGLHVNFTNEAQRLIELDDPVVARDELRRQFDRFFELVGYKPTHLDSHQHVHRGPACLPAFEELAAEAAIERIIRGELTGGIYEMACHPGYFDEAMEMVYHRDRELELRTLCDPRLRAILSEEGIRLIGYRQLPEAIKAIGWTPPAA